MTEYEFIVIRETGRSTSGKTKVWEVTSKQRRNRLGSVRWHAPWRQYTFQPAAQVHTIFSAGCLRDIAGFVKDAQARHV